MWLRVLLAITCVALLAAVGYYFWTEYQRNAEEAHTAEFAKQRQYCLSSLNRYASKAENERSEDLKQIMEHCINSGMLSADDVNAARDALFGQ